MTRSILTLILLSMFCFAATCEKDESEVGAKKPATQEQEVAITNSSSDLDEISNAYVSEVDAQEGEEGEGEGGEPESEPEGEPEGGEGEGGPEGDEA